MAHLDLKIRNIRIVPKVEAMNDLNGLMTVMHPLTLTLRKRVLDSVKKSIIDKTIPEDHVITLRLKMFEGDKWYDAWIRQQHLNYN